jgi:hypothetical protein
MYGALFHQHQAVRRLTRATLPIDENARDELSLADKVFCKLDGTEAPTFRRLVPTHISSIYCD